ncbi:unnamed protein product [Symbiodinium microadriaticum]|nr:unnamed protein product [Symbiodinium microadriaticum]CAE7234816.1 unnamed protein product [Symbiodinium sp. KB8]
MSYENFSAIKAKVQGAFDDVEAWIFQAFEGPVQDLDIDEDLELELAQRRRGMRFFAAGRARDGKRFASILFPLFQGDPNKDLYEEAFCDVLRVAGNSVKPGSRHKLSFRAGVLFFTADSLGNTYGVVASDDFPLANAYNFLEEMLQVYHSIDVEIALNEAEESLWSEPRFREDAFGIRELAIASWKKQLRPGDGSAQVQLSVLPLQEALCTSVQGSFVHFAIMFGGKKLKDLTEEDIRKYAASLVAMHGGQEEAATDGEIRLAANDTGNRNGYVESGMEDESSAHRKRLAQVIASNAAGDPDRIDEGDPEALQQRTVEGMLAMPMQPAVSLQAFQCFRIPQLSARVARAAGSEHHFSARHSKRWYSVAGVFAAAAARGRCAHMRTVTSVGPKPVWDSTGGPAIHGVGGRPRLEKGKLHRVIWMCWTGNNPMPAHLRLCMETVRRNAGLPVVLITPQNVTEYVPDPHPAYPYLHLAHRADYLRCYLLHNYGGLYLDVDTICLRSLAGLYELVESNQFDAVGYDGSEWGELIGVSDMGPFRPNSELTQLWFNALHGRLEEKLPEVMGQKTDVFYWQEILRDVFVPVSLVHSQRISKALLAHNPEKETLWAVRPFQEALGKELGSHILILNNAKYGDELGQLSEDEILGGPAVLSQLLRHSLGLPDVI